ncbi:MAG: hypothetical protein HQL56_05725 [Magnetococcales bacterium]|nr:hypothetical protein [Magnetococcales bacterium]
MVIVYLGIGSNWGYNAVPPPAARAVAEVIGRAIMLARAGETFALGSTPIWVRQMAAAVSAGV